MRRAARCRPLLALGLLLGALHGPAEAESGAALASAPQWLRLIHWRSPTAARPRDILSPDFYLSHPPSPAAELRATLSALRDPAPGRAQSTRCRFPARAHWLAGALEEPTLAAGIEQCEALQAWLPDPERDRLLAIQVTGYFGNPASAFGHLMLRIAPGGRAVDRGLLDRGINVGARIPTDESTFAYIWRGLSGGYRARFSEAPNHRQDHVYAATESRDMWAYELALRPDQLLLLSLHLWELRGVDLSYYFLRQNCAWRIAELLALALARPIGPSRQPYYLPDDVFLALESIDREQDGALIVERHFLPSLAHRAASRLSRLSGAERRALANWLDAPGAGGLQPLSTAAQDYLLDYFDHRLARAAEDDRDRWQRDKQWVLAARGERTDAAAPIPAAAPPALGSPPRALALWMGRRGDRREGQLELSAYRFELIERNRGGLANGALRVGELRLDRRAGDTQIERLGLIAAIRLGSPLGELTPSRSSPAWRFALALDRLAGPRLRPRAQGAIGRAWVRREASAYAMLGAALAPLDEQLLAAVESGLVWRPVQRHWSLQLALQSRPIGWSNAPRGSRAALAVRWRLSRRWAAEAGVERRPGERELHHRAGLIARW